MGGKREECDLRGGRLVGEVTDAPRQPGSRSCERRKQRSSVSMPLLYSTVSAAVGMFCMSGRWHDHR